MTGMNTPQTAEPHKSMMKIKGVTATYWRKKKTFTPQGPEEETKTTNEQFNEWKQAKIGELTLKDAQHGVQSSSGKHMSNETWGTPQWNSQCKRPRNVHSNERPLREEQRILGEGEGAQGVTQNPNETLQAKPGKRHMLLVHIATWKSELMETEHPLPQICDINPSTNEKRESTDEELRREFIRGRELRVIAEFKEELINYIQREIPDENALRR